MRRLFVLLGCVSWLGCVVDQDSTLTTPDPVVPAETADAGTRIAPPFEDPQASCAIACHGTDSNNAPPMSVSRQTATTSVGVGAHQKHLEPAPSWHRAVVCSDCHLVPETLTSPGHIDGDNKAEVKFSARVGPSAAWNGTTCTVGCHGSAALGGSSPLPKWTQVDGVQSTCGSCHGVPPPPPHPASMLCASCHPTMEEGSLKFRDPASHINGVVDVVPAETTGGCTNCHGTGTNSAPPKDLSGDTALTAAGVGAHQAHLKTSTWRKEIACSSCHVVPVALNSPGHIDGDNKAEVKFDALNPASVYTAATTTCSNNYCHGNGRGNTGSKSWVTPGALPCTGCHATNGTGMSGQHARHIVRENMTCSGCHADVANANLTIKTPALHVNGAHEIKMNAGTWNATTRSCANTGCHGTKGW